MACNSPSPADAFGQIGGRAHSRSAAARALGLVQLAVLGAILLSLPGCGGCRQTASEEEKKQQDEEDERPAFNVGQLRIQPSDETEAQLYVKPGHYLNATQRLVANRDDATVELETTLADRQGRPLNVPYSRFSMVASRSVSLPKGQPKVVDANFFVPQDEAASGRRTFLQSQLLTRSGRELQAPASRPAISMAPYQYRLVVLSSTPDRYGYLRTLDTVEPPDDEFDDSDNYRFFRVVLSPASSDVPIPAQAFHWTSTAALVWDDLTPELLTPSQQAAVVDWLHFGGQLIISGPDGLELLRGSFLAPYLPAEVESAAAVGGPALDAFNAGWTVVGQAGGQPLSGTAGKPLLGVQLRLRDGGQFMGGTGELVAERVVGRGRVVATAFSLSDPSLLRWPSFDSFVNGCLLRRPQREFTRRAPYCRWRDVAAPPREALADARLNCGLRFLSRDLEGLPGGTAPATVAGPTASGPPAAADEQVWRDGGFRADAEGGVGGWADFAGVSAAARQSLVDAAGVSVPKADFVLRVLLIYLVVLVPLNWGFFRLIRRVEWAWVAAPLITIVAAILVVRYAQLDIGFVRSRTELGLLELHAGYPRGHLTRYTALYTSLATHYRLQFDDDTSLAQPFPEDQVPRRENIPIRFRRESNLVLDGFQVDSNKTGLVHSEQIYALDGGFRWEGDDQQGFQVRNGSQLALEGVGVLRRRRDGQVEFSWLEKLAAGESRAVAFTPLLETSPRPEQWDRLPISISREREVRQLLDRLKNDGEGGLTLAELRGGDSPDEAADWLAAHMDQFDEDRSGTLEPGELEEGLRMRAAGEIGVGRLVDLLTGQLALGRGEVRLIGWTDQLAGGLKITPAAAQVQARLLVVVHLQTPLRPAPRPDVNLRTEVLRDLLTKEPDVDPVEPPTTGDPTVGDPAVGDPDSRQPPPAESSSAGQATSRPSLTPSAQPLALPGGGPGDHSRCPGSIDGGPAAAGAASGGVS